MIWYACGDNSIGPDDNDNSHSCDEDKDWVDNSIINLCRGFDHFDNFRKLLVSRNDIIGGILIIEKF